MVGGVCKVIFMSNPTVVLRLGWGFDNILKNYKVRANLRVSLVFIFGPKLNNSGLHGGGQKKYCVVGLLGGMLLSNSAHQQACYSAIVSTSKHVMI